MAQSKRAPSREAAPQGQQQNGLVAREHVAELQRARMIGAMAEVSAERGAANVTVAHVVDRAGVSRRTFYELFTDREDCFLAAFEEGLARMAQCVMPVYEQPGRWRDRIRACLIEFLSFLDNDPVTGRLLVVDTLGAGHRALERRRRVLAQVIEAVDDGRAEAKKDQTPPPLTAEGVVGGVLSVLYGRLTDVVPSSAARTPQGSNSSSESLLELTGPLMSMIVLPYLGPVAARKELALPVVPPARSSQISSANPLLDLEMRLTYRTIRVLQAIASQPGSSNRQVANDAEVTDQGQMSKLLARLLKLGLIANTGAGQARGEPNAWTLTQRGWEIQSAITAQGHQN